MNAQGITTAAVFACLVALTGSGCGTEPPKRNLLLIVVDTLRWDHVGSYGASSRDTTPSLDAFARESIRFDRAYSTAPWTRPSIGSMITGLYPSAHGGTGVDIPLPDDALTLAEILWSQGYATEGVVSNWVISEKNGFAQGFDLYHEAASAMQKTSTSQMVSEQARKLLEQRADDETPFFLFAHFFDPHFRYLPHPDVGWAGRDAPEGGARQSEVGRIAEQPSMFELRKLGAELEDDEIQNLRDLYAEEIHHADAQVGALLEAVDALGLRESTVVAIVSDHGEEIFDRDYLGHAHSLHEELIRVPFLLRVPDETARVVETPVSLVSLTPTLLDALGIDQSAFDFQSSSLMPLVHAEPGAANTTTDYHFVEVDFIPQHKIVRTSRRQGIVGERFKLSRDLETNELSLYDLANDPNELNDLAASRPDLVRDLLPRLEDAIRRASQGALDRRSTTLSEEDREMLESLGYIDPGH